LLFWLIKDKIAIDMATRETAEKLRITETESMRIAARVYDERLKLAETEFERAKISGEDQENLEILEIKIENLRLEKDLYLWQHDTTGAWKGDRFGSELRDFFDSQARKNPKTKKMEFGPDLSRSHVMMVNMGELDRLNDAGEHDLGDRALELTVSRISEVCAKIILESRPELAGKDEAVASMFSVFRVAGNDFTVILKDMDTDAAKRIQSAIAESPISVDEIRKGVDAAPLTVDMLSMSAVAETYGRLAESKPPKMDESTFLITILKEKLQTINDFNKVRNRFTRIVEKIRQPGGSIDARTLYEKFLQKSLGSAFSEGGEKGMDFDSFVKQITLAGALDGDSTAWYKTVFNKAAESAISQYLSRNTGNRENAQKLLALMLEDLAKVGQEVGISTLQIEPKADFAGFTEIGESQKEAIKAFDGRRAFLGQTEGEDALVELTSQLEGEFGSDEKGQAEKRAAELKLAIEKAKRDTLTGLSLRGVFYQYLESKFKNDEPVSIVSIDMAFLGYFDKEGGTLVGNEAIKTAARILDYVKRHLKSKGIDAESSRLGGDEFALTIGSADKDIINEAVAMIRDAQAEVGRVPAYEGALTTFAPEAMQFNVGISIAPSRQEFIDHLKSKGIDLPADATERQIQQNLSDYLARIADTQIESGKNVERFVFLLNRSLAALNAPEEQRAARQLNLQTLTAYSEKAIFGSAGKAKMAEWLSLLQDEEISVKDLVTREIIPFVKQELQKKGKEEFQMGESLERAMEYELRLTLNQIYIEELEASLEARLDELGEEHERVISLKKQLESSHQEMNELKNLRQQIKALG